MKKTLEQIVTFLTAADDLLVRDGRDACPLSEHVEASIDVERCSTCKYLRNIEFDTELCEYRVRCSPRRPDSGVFVAAGR
jgi:hypothetical protein